MEGPGPTEQVWFNWRGRLKVFGLTEYEVPGVGNAEEAEAMKQLGDVVCHRVELETVRMSPPSLRGVGSQSR